MFKETFNVIITTAILAILVSFVLPVEAFATEGGRIGAQPANPNPENPRTSAIFLYNTGAESIIRDEVLLINNRDRAARIKVYPTDSAISNDGSFTCEQFLETDDEVGSWISFPQQEYELAANSTLRVAFNLQVPKDVEPGEYNGCVVIEEAEDVQKGPGISISTRMGIRLAVRVTGKIVKQLEISDFQLINNNGKLVLRSKIRNVGNVSIDTKVTTNVLLFERFQIYTNSGKFPILRDQESTINYDFPRPFWGGWYLAELQVSYDQNPENNLGVETDIVTLKRNFHFWLMPHWSIFAIAGTVTGICLLLVWISRRSRRYATSK